nr:MAG TPA: hypothetical protein [Caudoviricetes sp.]
MFSCIYTYCFDCKINAYICILQVISRIIIICIYFV